MKELKPTSQMQSRLSVFTSTADSFDLKVNTNGYSSNVSDLSALKGT